MTSIRRSAPPPPTHHTQASSTPQNAAGAQHAAAPGQTAAGGGQQAKQTDGGKSAKQQPQFSGGMKGPSPGPRQPGNKGGNVKGGSGKKSSSVSGSRRKSRRSPISGDDDENSWDDAVEEAEEPATAVGGGGMGDAGSDRGSGQHSQQDRKKDGGIEHSRNMGNYVSRGGVGGIKLGMKLPTGEALIRREVLLLEGSVKQLAKMVTAPVKPEDGETHLHAWGRRIGEVKRLGLKVSRELGKLGVTHFDQKRMPSTKELMLKFFPKPDRSQGPPSEEQAGLNRMAWMIVHTFRRIRTPVQAKLNRAHLRVRVKQRNRTPTHG